MDLVIFYLCRKSKCFRRVGNKITPKILTTFRSNLTFSLSGQHIPSPCLVFPITGPKLHCSISQPGTPVFLLQKQNSIHKKAASNFSMRRLSCFFYFGPSVAGGASRGGFCWGLCCCGLCC
jgi:hypothetical protein